VHDPDGEPLEDCSDLVAAVADDDDDIVGRRREDRFDTCLDDRSSPEVEQLLELVHSRRRAGREEKRRDPSHAPIIRLLRPQEKSLYSAASGVAPPDNRVRG
jgi:hypothetical protein